jgi:uncharacterized protein (DUF1697 family)
MTKYVALLRGIGPGNPNMHGSKLKAVLEELGFSNVASVISSGNVIFESSSKDLKKLEQTIEKAWPEKLGFKSMTIVRSQSQLKSLVSQEPFKGMTHDKKTYLLVTFFKSDPGKINEYYYDGLEVNALCSVTDTTQSNSPEFMVKLEKNYGKEITSRTWNTVQRILLKMN